MRNLTLFSGLCLAAGLLCLSGCPCQPAQEMTLTEIPGDELAFAVTGPYGFEGTLYNPLTDDIRWEFEGAFHFPHPGYFVSQEVSVAESFPEQVHVRFAVLEPGPGVYPQVIDVQPVAATINVSDGATFRITVEGRCLPGAGN
jgi:hypothetical protein